MIVLRGFSGQLFYHFARVIAVKPLIAPFPLNRRMINSNSAAKFFLPIWKERL
jgi:hypothetical protein